MVLHHLSLDEYALLKINMLGFIPYNFFFSDGSSWTINIMSMPQIIYKKCTVDQKVIV